MIATRINSHRDALLRALALAEVRRGFCSPNPAVGAVLVKDGKVLAEGYHWANGCPHAEAEVLTHVGVEAKEATLYVTLEPCCHREKKTPPCTELIIASGIRQVVFAYKDPNPQVAGGGARMLQAAGIVCEQVALPEITDFYQSYQHWWQTGLPWVTAKLALSLDGKIAGKAGKRETITGAELQVYTHQQRYRSDAILTTSKTIIQDNPELNVRLDGKIQAKPLYILDSQLRLPSIAKIFKTAAEITVFHHAKASQAQRDQLEALGVQCIAVPNGSGKKLSLAAILAIIGRHGRHNLWVEAGGECFQSFLTARLLQQAYLYVAPKWLGSEAQSAFAAPIDLLADAKSVSWRAVGNETICEVNW